MLHTSYSAEYIFHYSTPFWGMQLDFLCFVSRSVVYYYSSLCKLSGLSITPAAYITIMAQYFLCCKSISCDVHHFLAYMHDKLSHQWASFNEYCHLPCVNSPAGVTRFVAASFRVGLVVTACCTVFIVRINFTRGIVHLGDNCKVFTVAPRVVDPPLLCLF